MVHAGQGVVAVCVTRLQPEGRGEAEGEGPGASISYGPAAGEVPGVVRHAVARALDVLGLAGGGLQRGQVILTPLRCLTYQLPLAPAPGRGK